MKLDRRDFLASAFAGGVFLASSSLRAFAADDRLPLGSLSLNYLRMDVGAAKPFSVLHVSDTHLSAVNADEDAKKLRLNDIRTSQLGGRQEEALRAAVAWAKSHTDYFIHTGDIVDFHSRANADIIRATLGEALTGVAGEREYARDGSLSAPSVTETDANRALSSAWLGETLPFSPDCSSRVVNGVNFVVLDNCYAVFRPEQVAFFNDEVKKGLPIVLCCHMPLFTDFIWQAYEKCHRFHNCNRKSIIFDTRVIPISDAYYRFQINNSATNAFVKYLKTEKLLKGILAGHLHMTVNERFSPTAIQAVTGANYLFHAQKVNFS